jgi:DNA-directed RNA polymerase specialized sigma24 family protein
MLDSATSSAQAPNLTPSPGTNDLVVVLFQPASPTPVPASAQDPVLESQVEALAATVANSVVRDLPAGWDKEDVIQETTALVIRRLRKSANSPICNIVGYVTRTMQRVVQAARVRARRSKPLAAIPGGEDTLEARNLPAPFAEEMSDLAEFSAFLARQHQPDPERPMPKILRVLLSSSADRSLTAQRLDLTTTELIKHLQAIGDLHAIWLRTERD